MSKLQWYTYFFIWTRGSFLLKI